MLNFISYFLCSPFLFLLIFILCFALPIVIITSRRKKREKYKEFLNKKSIMLSYNILSKISLMWFLLFIIILGIIVIYLISVQSGTFSSKIPGIIFGGIMCLIPSIIILNNLKVLLRIQTGQYVIVLDELSDKYHYSDNRTNENDYSEWKLFFKDYFKKYNVYVPIKSLKLGNKYNIGDKFYLVFVKGNTLPYIYPLQEYTLDELEKNKLTTLEKAKNFINIKEFTLETNNINFEKRTINKKILIADFNKWGHKKTVIIDIFICLFLLVFGLISIFIFKNVLAFIITVLIFIFFLFITVVKIQFVYTITKNIKCGYFEIKKDEVISLNNGVEFQDSNSVISFKFKNYKSIVFADKKDFNNVSIGDEFYLIFVKNEKKPINVYKVNDVILADDVKNMII